MANDEPVSSPWKHEFLAGLFASLRETADQIRGFANPDFAGDTFTGPEYARLKEAAQLVEDAYEHFAALIGSDRVTELERRRGQPAPPTYLGDSIGAVAARIVQYSAIISGCAQTMGAYENELTDEEVQDLRRIEALVAEALNDQPPIGGIDHLPKHDR